MDVVKNMNSDAVFGEGGATLLVEKDYIRVSNRNENYSYLAVHANKLLGDKQAYKSTLLVKLPEGEGEINLKIYHKISIDYLDVKETSYACSEDYTVNGKDWTEMTFSATVPFESTILDYIVYFIQSSGKKSDILIKAYDVEETEPKNLGERIRNYPPVKSQDKRLVGTIRWDAFTESTPNGIKPCDQVARVLSHKEYHNQAPFFSLVNGEQISFPEYTMETWEKETDYAIKGGLDYFAYLWYETYDEMSQPRKMHLKSPNKDKILMCGILERVRSNDTMNELYNAMKESCYLRLDTRPVVFLYGMERWTKEEVQKVCEGAREQGIQEPLYIVGMSTATSYFPFMNNLSNGVDAVSWYSVGAEKKDMTFEELKNVTEDVMKKVGEHCRKNNIDIIPAFTTGRDTRARIRTGVTWCAGDPNAKEDKDKPYHNFYALPPSDRELEEHIESTLKYVNENRDITRSYMVCSYGWNEHEEGGWLCPTLKTDENNNVVLDDKGNILPDTKRLDILRKVKDRT